MQTNPPILDISSGVEKGVNVKKKITNFLNYLKKMNSTNYKNIDFHSFPDELGRFGNYGGRFVAETLMPLLIDVEKEYLLAKNQNHLTNNSIIIFLTMLVDQVHYILPKDFQKT